MSSWCSYLEHQKINLQLTLEPHGFEMRRSTCARVFLNGVLQYYGIQGWWNPQVAGGGDLNLQGIPTAWRSTPLTAALFKGQLSSLVQTVLLFEVHSSHVIFFNPEFSTNWDFTWKARRAHLFFNCLCCILSCFGLALKKTWWNTAKATYVVY